MYNDLKVKTMTAKEFIEKEGLEYSLAEYDEGGFLGIDEHLLEQKLEEYYQAKLKLLTIADVITLLFDKNMDLKKYKKLADKKFKNMTDEEFLNNFEKKGNQVNDFSKKLKEYLEQTPKEKVLEEWTKFEEYDNIGPTVKEFTSHLNGIKNIEIKKTVLEILDELYQYEHFKNWWDKLSDKEESEIENNIQTIIEKRFL